MLFAGLPPSAHGPLLQSAGMPEQKVTVQSTERAGQQIDLTVAAQDVQEGEMLLRMPEHLIITLEGVFEDEAVAELLATGKLTELACLTLYLAYEKKRGKDSCWYHYIRELDRQRGRGQQGAKSPLLWDAGQVDSLLEGSPVVGMVKERLKGIEREYAELDTVWYMAGSLFSKYPFDMPTEAFSLDLFTQAFAATQASVVHLQGVPMSKRFALVPMGPPLLSYSSTVKAMLRYDSEAREVRLVADRAYCKGEPVYAWCGPQPNQRLLLNYGIVDESNPHDRLQLTATIPSSDRLYPQKRNALQQLSLSSQQSFWLLRHQDLPDTLMPFLRLAHCQDEEALRHPSLHALQQPLPAEQERALLANLASCLQRRLNRYRTSSEQDEAVIADPAAGPREKVAARLLKLEKSILTGALNKVAELPGGAEVVQQAPQQQRDSAVRLQ
eukprot:jgi/Astpho2/308/fgenesh1_pg.00010_%23_65_t